MVSVQHEYGIFGGKAGSHVLALLRELRMPIVTTLHTILARAEPACSARVMDELIALSERLVVMSRTAARSSCATCTASPERKIDVIPHGIPNVPVRRQQGQPRRRQAVR